MDWTSLWNGDQSHRIFSDNQEVGLSISIQFSTLQGIVVPARWNHCDTLTSRMLLLVLRKISGDHVLGLCWEARHLLTWQPILTLYSKLKGGMRERDHRK